MIQLISEFQVPHKNKRGCTIKRNYDTPSSFNSIKVRVKRTEKTLKVYLYSAFNSIKVRVKRWKSIHGL